MEVCNDRQMAQSQRLLHEQQSGLPPVSQEGTRHVHPDSSVQVDVPFIHYKQTARVQEVELPVDVTHVHVEKVEVQAPHEIPIIQPRELGIHQQTKRNNPSPIDVFTVQKYQLPRLRPMYYDVEVPIYVPRYVEVPVPSHFVSLNQDPLPDTLQLGPCIKSGLATAPVPVDKQVYSLAPMAAPHAPQRSSHGGDVSAFRPHYLVRAPEKENEGSTELMYFPPSVNEGLSTSNSSRFPMRPAYYLTPSFDRTSNAPSHGIATMLRQNATEALNVLQPYSQVLEIRHVAGMQGVASMGQAAASGSVSGSSMDHRVTSMCSPSLVPAARCEAPAAAEQLPQGEEELPEAGNQQEAGRPPLIEIAA